MKDIQTSKGGLLALAPEETRTGIRISHLFSAGGKEGPFVADKKDMEDLLDAKQVKKILRCSLPLVYRMAERGQLPCIRWDCPGNGTRKKTMVRFELQAIRAFIENHRRE